MKYIGPLEKRPIIPAAQAPDAFDRFVTEYHMNYEQILLTPPDTGST